MQGRSPDRDRAPAPGTIAKGRAIRVALDNIDIVYLQPHAIRDDCRVGRLVSLAVGEGSDIGPYTAVTLHPDDRHLIACMQPTFRFQVLAGSGSGFVEEAGQSDAHIDALGTKRLLLFPK